MVNLGTTIYEPTTPILYWLHQLHSSNQFLDLSDINEFPNDARTAKSAILVVEKTDPNLNQQILARFTEDGIIEPNGNIITGVGVPLTNLSIYQIRPNALHKFRINTVNNATVNLHFHFYI